MDWVSGGRPIAKWPELGSAFGGGSPRDTGGGIPNSYRRAYDAHFLQMKTLFTAEAISKGGRSGTIQTPDRLLDVTLGNPMEKGIEERGPNPELLFAGAYSACYHGALGNAAKKLGTPVRDSTVRALVSLIEEDQGGYRLAVELHAQLPGLDRAQAQRLMDEAHRTCPYSRALRGDTSVKLVVD